MHSSAAGVEFRQLIRLAGPLALAQAGTQIYDALLNISSTSG